MEKLIMISNGDDVELELTGNVTSIAQSLYGAMIEDEKGVLAAIICAASEAYIEYQNKQKQIP